MYLDEGGGAAGQAGSSLWNSVQQFTRLAADGGFAVSPTGGQPMLDVLDRFIREMDDQEDKLQFISREPPLGRLEGGKVMAPFMVQVATDENGFVTRFRELRPILIKAREGIAKAMANYEETEAENEAKLRRFQGDLE